METKANYLMIGGFVLGVLAIAFLFVFWMSNFGGGGKRYTIVFDSSVAGLTTGSSVGFNGIRVGEVQSFALDPEDARKVRVLISVRDDTPVRQNSRASIQSMGLTGGSGIQITPGTPETPFLVATAEDPVPVIRSEAGAGQGVFEAGSAALNNANVFISKLNALLDDNEKSINTTMTNVEQFTSMLSEKREEIGKAITDVSEGAQSFKSLSEKLEVSLGDNVDGLTRQAQEGIQEFGSFMREGRRVAVTLNRILERLEADPRGFLLGGNQVPEYTPRGR
ncbi:MAG: MlaD family protein [Methyloceanibacter sp.]|jgi:phospholipid/cholesterol/gamma-HCH transport system substrate-binding protein